MTPAPHVDRVYAADSTLLGIHAAFETARAVGARTAGPLGPGHLPMVIIPGNRPAITRAPAPRPLIEAGDHVLAGLAVPYLEAARDAKGRRFLFARGAFDGSLMLIQAYLNHDHAAHLGCSSDGSLKLRNAREGLYFELALTSPRLRPDHAAQLTQAARTPGRLTGASPGWVVQQKSWSPRLQLWIVTRADLYEISILSEHAPLFSSTWVALDRAGRQTTRMACRACRAERRSGVVTCDSANGRRGPCDRCGRAQGRPAA